MRQTPNSLMLFAAGFGTRMGDLVAARPKPMVTVAGRTLIDRALEIADDAGIDHKVINLHYLGDQIAAHLAHRTDITWSWERDKILETGGGLKAALHLLKEGTIFTLNPDVVWAGQNPLAQLRAAWDATTMDALLLLLPVSALKGRDGRADFLLGADGRIARAGSAGQHVYVGAQIVQTNGLTDIAESVFSLNLLWDKLIAKNRAFGLIYHGDWCDVGTPKGVAEATLMLAGIRV